MTFIHFENQYLKWLFFQFPQKEEALLQGPLCPDLQQLHFKSKLGRNVFIMSLEGAPFLLSLLDSFHEDF